jgi:S-adenosylhomocysteine hydrolase/8-oxo-dGTP pyrophosphatase MutT (NUDIX family)
MPDSIRQAVETYVTLFPAEAQRQTQLRDFLKHIPTPEALYSRKTFVGHITASGIIISRRSRKVLLIHHKALTIYLQPGGHVDGNGEGPLNAARREITEETGLADLTYIPYHADPIVPIDIDTHAIPENSHKQEPDHFHYDFRYLFLYEGPDDAVRITREELDAARWIEVSELARIATFSAIVEKLLRVFSPQGRHRRFYSELTQSLDLKVKPAVLVVAHILPDVEVYLEALQYVADLRIIIPKPRSIDRATLEGLQWRYPIEHISRQNVAQNARIQSLIGDTRSPLVIFDIGGYFAPVVNEAKRQHDHFVGVIEDTENGHQKYEHTPDLAVPVCSVARSPLKDNEDFLVGQSVLFSTDALLREIQLLVQYLRCGVLGYGKIGASIAHHLLLRGIKPSVFDINALRRLQAFNRQCEVPLRDVLIRESDVLFCATGNQALNIHDIRRLRPGCFVVSVTSSDDEMDLTYLKGEYSHENISEFIVRYTSFNNYFYLVNNGNAVNFIHRAVLGDFIHLVRAEMIAALKVMIEDHPEPGIFSLSDETRKRISMIWLRTFVDDNIGLAM